MTSASGLNVTNCGFYYATQLLRMEKLMYNFILRLEHHLIWQVFGRLSHALRVTKDILCWWYSMVQKQHTVCFAMGILCHVAAVFQEHLISFSSFSLFSTLNTLVGY